MRHRADRSTQALENSNANFAIRPEKGTSSFKNGCTSGKWLCVHHNLLFLPADPALPQPGRTKQQLGSVPLCPSKRLAGRLVR
jgi:hypothetical protein